VVEAVAVSFLEKKTMKVLIIGSGGREHALAWALSRSPDTTHIYVSPGN
jgi:phosphoribosylamine---glycine ligase